TAGHREQQGEFTGWRKYFNSYTPQGRRNVCTLDFCCTVCCINLCLIREGKFAQGHYTSGAFFFLRIRTQNTYFWYMYIVTSKHWPITNQC
uniref:Uncharacterized protein n=1 Tax=Periophthalmus magnuspinnatus TaxID=409849 RepID=A0A3B3ZCW8_9GOBI